MNSILVSVHEFKKFKNKNKTSKMPANFLIMVVLNGLFFTSIASLLLQITDLAIPKHHKYEPLYVPNLNL